MAENKQSPFRPAWIPKQTEEGFSEEEMRRRVGSHIQEAKIALELDKEEMKKSAQLEGEKDE
jgi:hypothetical protein